MRDWFKSYGTFLGAIVLSLVIVGEHYVHEGGSPDRFNTVAAAKLYKKDIINNFHDSYADAAKAIRSGKTLDESQKNLIDDIKMKNQKAFLGRFAAVVPLLPKEGTEPASPEAREYMAKFLDDISKGFE